MTTAPEEVEGEETELEKSIKSIKTVGDLEKVIEEQAGLAMNDLALPMGDFVGWFDKQFVRNKKVPFKGKHESLVVLAIYHDEAEIRVYALSLENDKVPPHRFVMSKTAQALVGEILDLECFVEEIVEEIQILAKVDHAANLADAIRTAFEKKDMEILRAALAEYEGYEEDEEDAPESGPAPTAQSAEQAE